jgi:hypothetical protein
MAGRSARPGLVDLLLSIDDPVGIRSRLGKHSGGDRAALRQKLPGEWLLVDSEIGAIL